MSNTMIFQKKLKFFSVLFAIVLAGQSFAFSELELGINVNFMFNVEADFKGPTRNLGGPGPATGSGFDRFYEDGFNRPGFGGDELTSFWGYENANQLPGNDTLVLTGRSMEISNFEEKDVDNSAQPGIEIFLKIPLVSRNGVTWGIRENISYFMIEVEERSTLRGNVREISDAFALNGVIAPDPPFSGSPSGPGPLISNTPNRIRNEIVDSAVISGEYELDVDMLSYGLGYYWDFFNEEGLNLSIDGGMLFTWIFSDFSFNEGGTAIGSGDSVTNRNSGSKNEFLFGGFIGATISIELSSNLALQGGARYQTMEDFDHAEDGLKAELDFSGVAILSIGLSYLF